MEFYVSGWTREGRFKDPRCLIHETADKQLGIIVHDGSGRYSIIRYCPWCGEPLTEEARILARGNALDYSILAEPPTTDASIYKESDVTHFRRPAPRRVVTKTKKGGHVWTAAERLALSEKAKAKWAEKKRSAAAEANDSPITGT